MPDPIDIHAHAMPMPVLDWLESRGLAELGRIGDPTISGVGKGAPLPLAPSMTDPTIRLQELDAMGVGRQAVSLPPFLMASMCEDEVLATEVISRGNDALVDYCRTDPERLLGLGSVPVGWPGALDEARRCLDMGMRGIAIGSRGACLDLDASVNDALWAFLSEQGAFVFLHPSGVPDPPRLADFWFPQLVGYPMETAIAAARLAFSGVLERTPLTLCLAHGGGCLPSLRGRLDMGWERKEAAHTTASAPSLLFDRHLRRLVEDVGADHVLLGTDHPFELGERDPVGFVASAHLRPSEERAVLHDNAARLLGL